TAHLEPDSVILRDPAGRLALRVLEQNFRNDAISQGLLLALYEGKTIEFETTDSAGVRHVTSGKIVRSGYVTHAAAYARYGQQYAYQQQIAAQSGGGQPIVEADGKLLFQLPGRPIFPALTDQTILKPTLDWRIAADRAAKLDAELSYLSGGMSWHPDY